MSVGKDSTELVVRAKHSMCSQLEQPSGMAGPFAAPILQKGSVGSLPEVVTAPETQGTG